MYSLKRNAKNPIVDQLFNDIQKKVKKRKIELFKYDYMREYDNKQIELSKTGLPPDSQDVGLEYLMPDFGRFAEDQWIHNQHEANVERELQMMRTMEKEQRFMNYLTDAPSQIIDMEMWKAYETTNGDLQKFIPIVESNSAVEFNRENDVLALSNYNRELRQKSHAAGSSQALRSAMLNRDYKSPTTPNRHEMKAMSISDFTLNFQYLTAIENERMKNDERLINNRVAQTWVENALKGVSGHSHGNTYKLNYARQRGTVATTPSSVHLFLTYKNNVYDTSETLDMVISNITNDNLNPIDDNPIAMQNGDNIFALLNSHISDSNKTAIYESQNLAFLPFSKILNVKLGGLIKFRNTTKWNPDTLDRVQKEDAPIFKLNSAYASASAFGEQSTDAKAAQKLIDALEPIVNNWAYRIGIGYGNSRYDIEDVIRNEMSSMVPSLYEKYSELAFNYNAHKLDDNTGWYMVHMVAQMFFREHKIPFYNDWFASQLYENFFVSLDDKTFLQHVNDSYSNIFNRNSNASSQAKIETCMILSVLYSNKMGQLNKIIRDYVDVFDNENVNKFVSDFINFISFKEKTDFSRITKDIKTPYKTRGAETRKRALGFPPILMPSFETPPVELPEKDVEDEKKIEITPKETEEIEETEETKETKETEEPEEIEETEEATPKPTDKKDLTTLTPPDS